MSAPLDWLPAADMPIGVDVLGMNATGDLQRCWRFRPSSRTDKILTYRQTTFKALWWLPLEALNLPAWRDHKERSTDAGQASGMPSSSSDRTTP